MSDKLLELLKNFQHDPILRRLPMPQAIREQLNLHLADSTTIMEAADSYMKASSLPATGVIIDGTVEHKDVVFPEFKPTVPLEIVKAD